MDITGGGDASSSMCGHGTGDDAQSFPQRVRRPYHTAMLDRREIGNRGVALDGAQKPVAELRGGERSGFVFLFFVF